jgi:hypothetical protein
VGSAGDGLFCGAATELLVNDGHGAGYTREIEADNIGDLMHEKYGCDRAWRVAQPVAP